MKQTDFKGYLSLLREAAQLLEKLTGIQQKKSRAVREDDLEGLNECIRQEQALGLALRGCEQKRACAQRALGLEGLGLDALAERAPAECRAEARRVAEALRGQYRLYRGAAEVARSTLECNLHQIEIALRDMGAEPAPGGGYTGETPAPPRPMRTDFRA